MTPRVPALLAALALALGTAAAPARPPTPLPKDQAYRAYVRTVLVDAVGTAVGLARLRDCRSDRTQCEHALGQVQGRVGSFQSDLDENPPPACLAPVDSRLRTGLDFFHGGLQVVQQGVQEEDSARLIAGAALALAGAVRLARAIGQALTTDC